MKIVIVNSLYTPHIIGGAEISTQILAETLASAAEVHVLTVGPQGRSAGVESEFINGVTVHRLPYNNLYWIGEGNNAGTLKKTGRRLIDLYNPVQIRTVRQLLARIDPDLIHTQNLSGFGAAIWTAAKPGVPIVHTLRDYSLLSPVSSPIGNPALARMYQWSSRGVSKRVSAVVGISSHILKRHTDDGLFPNAAKLVISNVVDGDIAGADKEFDRKPLRIGYFGRIEPEKGVRELVEAVQSLPREVVEHVIICGDGGFRQKLTELCGSDDRFLFTGKVTPNEARSFMAKADVTFVPSIWEEPFGRVIIESYQVGTPVYASAVGGIPDAVWNPAEFLFKPGSADAIKEKITAFHGLPGEEKRRIQAECLKHCSGFTKGSLLDKHLDLYARMTKSGSPAYALTAVNGRS
ncbi:glycosyltransferase family 4 protein [Paenibacillus sacheonensis]|uniref:Glycosyltransferase n=1 Tax=Paenibacillus sacheonensis TaxID=742054 RepID=A0A7X4YRE0_9BACL|nr:glycosyltransferase family 4 protein [Paenibacillus sacheonensis]MBM7563609.1 glycosyltransferase involved in cell wall biosynthesis [Paenibacillus sacheonensis]NBC71095.1 glycosyltransferase [Paenibacillus sacheonensis]